MSYESTVLSLAPAAYWRLGESWGTWADSTANGRDATAAGVSTNWTAPDTGLVPGEADGAISNNTQAVAGGPTVPHGSWMDTQTLSVTCVTKVSAPPGSDFACPVSNRADATHDNCWAFYIQPSSGQMWVRLVETSTAEWLPSTSGDICDGIERHWVLTVTGTTAKLYCDGVLDATLTMAQPLATSSYGAPITIGHEWAVGATGSPRGLDGTVDEVAFWSGTALAAGDVTVLYRSFVGSLVAKVLLEWSSTTDLGLATTTVITDDDSAWQIPLDWSCLVELEAPEPDESADVPVPIRRVSITMPTPTLVNGLPTQPWTPSTFEEDWGNLYLRIGGASFTRTRGKRFLPLITAYEEPFGDAEASFAFPGWTDFDNLDALGIQHFDPVLLRRKDKDGNWHTVYEGEVASREADQGQGSILHTVGCLFRLDLLQEPPALYAVTQQDFGRIIADAFNRKRRDFALRIGHMPTVATGITGLPGSAFQPFLTGAIQSYLSQMMTDDGSQWTVKVRRPRTPVLIEKDRVTVTWTTSYGTPGVDCTGLTLDHMSGITAGYGSGANGHCQWMGARFPNETQGSTPSFPLAVGHSFVAGDGQTGFAPFAAFLRRGQYGTIVSDDTYDPADVDNVTQFQDRAGITASGDVDGQTWTAAFLGGFNQNSERGAYVDTLWEAPTTRRHLYNAQGAIVGPNPDFDPTLPRIETYIPFGDNVSKNAGRKSIHQIVDRSHPVGTAGTIIFTADPQEGSRLDIRAGDNIELDNHFGGAPLLRVARAQIDWQQLTVTCTVDEVARDLMTLGAIQQRRKDVSDLTRREKFGRTRSKVFNDYGTWLCEDGAGEIPLMTQVGGKFNVQRIAAGPKGTLERISLALGAGLTEHLLNVNLSDNPNATIPGAGRGVMAIFAKPVTPNALANLLGNPAQFDAAGKNPWDREADTLARMGMIYAAGGPGNQIGFYPNGDPGDGTDTDLSGRFEDNGGVQFGPTGRWHLWVAVYTTADCKAGGRLFPGPPG